MQGESPTPRRRPRPIRCHKVCLQARNTAFRDNIEIATLDPFHGYKNAIDDAIAVLDAFHVVKLGTTALDQVRRRVQQDTLVTVAAPVTGCSGSGT